MLMLGLVIFTPRNFYIKIRNAQMKVEMTKLLSSLILTLYMELIDRFVIAN